MIPDFDKDLGAANDAYNKANEAAVCAYRKFWVDALAQWNIQFTPKPGHSVPSSWDAWECDIGPLHMSLYVQPSHFYGCKIDMTVPKAHTNQGQVKPSPTGLQPYVYDLHRCVKINSLSGIRRFVRRIARVDAEIKAKNLTSLWP